MQKFPKHKDYLKGQMWWGINYLNIMNLRNLLEVCFLRIMMMLLKLLKTQCYLVLKCVTQDIKYEDLKIDNKLIYYFDKEIDNDENKIIKKTTGLSVIQSDGSAVYVIPTLECS